MNPTSVSFHLSRTAYVFLGIIAGVFIGMTIKFALGWNAPPCNDPTLCNADAPITVGNNVQTKQGSLNLGIGLRTNYDAYLATDGGNVGIGMTNPTKKLDVNGAVKAPEVCIGTDCRTSWPASTQTPMGASEVYKRAGTDYCGGTAFACVGIADTRLRQWMSELGGQWNGSRWVHELGNCGYVLCTQ